MTTKLDRYSPVSPRTQPGFGGRPDKAPDEGNGEQQEADHRVQKQQQRPASFLSKRDPHVQRVHRPFLHGREVLGLRGHGEHYATSIGNNSEENEQTLTTLCVEGEEALGQRLLKELKQQLKPPASRLEGQERPSM